MKSEGRTRNDLSDDTDGLVSGVSHLRGVDVDYPEEMRMSEEVS